ncbi:putative MFS-type transporter [Colletotrichum fructicola]|uniref:Major facilitator superfamily transporter n=1 Tax=Colletotrichum fructicola (strain Nara gc5) TaxID=1213859 RepID=L2FF63_COLFN|nr:uncharacterized protein CGMCC3_g6467 [Colletotrichum fructicola]KAF4489752.1 putative MFS-type transporter [Colletotrichum fructicola Nara gc5]KAE9577447.1 hypothetical protein CGMCC3_g6467 [Colletotrichum fructicola]KAF4412201.1 putative MFS-type transporter [Colletotrichum fructicola]KAF4884515.1 putative MFS-type transporter [Colletotrichum fructicola]KAF4891466.1 putative MFS-type transporter [Colletotrichum fructicola]
MSTVTTTQLSHESIDLRDVRNEFPLETERQNQSDGPTASKARQATTTFQLSGLNFLTSAVNGIILVSLPTLVAELNLPEQLHVWPISVYGLAVGSTILPVGSLADAAGSRIVDLVGCFSMALLLLASGFVKSGEQLVAYRALQGVAMSMHLASSVSLVTQSIPKGRARNVAFSCLGLSQPLGFSVGLVLGGVLVDTVGWRVGFYLTGGLSLLLSFVGLWALPKSRDRRTASEVVHELKRKMDWVGSLLASAFMVCLSYFLAIVSSDIGSVSHRDSIATLCAAGFALPAFVAWVHRQTRLGKPALIPNSLWRNTAFSSVCATMLLSFAVLKSMEQYCSLFFQEVQGLSATETSTRLLPSLVVGIILNFTTGLFVHKVSARWLVAGSSIVCAGGPVLMALAKPEWPYWYNAFFAQLLQPISGDILFTVGLIIVSEAFPEDTQALAGAVFNAASQFGTSLGLAIMQVVAGVVTNKAAARETPIDALLLGYRASFWAMTGFMVLCFALGLVGLHKTGKVGNKKED